ncbi:MAG: FKBP-type peptidyl-prolyl cis-trans isomerase [Bacteroidales bacterium]|jgi:FKBP-type peptidyl-prolyl cis-trans isomerase FkpA/FKBP-type peptidyl-prolyl cis-trans isomerase FklB|nr:FKBP-type peptidyl-prolyl cis-trans isomerase [Bacteroidales bacterium]
MNLTNDREKVSYIIGEDIGNSFIREGYDLDIEVLITALRAAVDGNDLSGLTDEQKNSTMQTWQAAEKAKREFLNQEISKVAIEEGKSFLSRNKSEAGVVETASGLQYKVLTEGKGAKPKATDTVHVHYHGTLINGDVFDSSVQRGEPISFPLNQVIPGWTEGLQLMNVGSKYRLFIPSNLAYGNQNMGAIPAGSTLIFDVELLDIK